MSISTGVGDKGKTSLWSGERVFKDDIRVEAYGTVDELDSHIGEAKHYCKSQEIKDQLLKVQRLLFKVAGTLASKDKQYTDQLEIEHIDWITQNIHNYEEILKLKGFVIPGNTIQSAKLDICRTIARRAERRVVSLSHNENVDEILRVFLNRLSYFLFICARYEEYLENKLLYKNDVL